MKVVNKLSNIESFKLFGYVEAEYTKQGITDAEFAKVASQSLGFTVLESNVDSARGALKIESTKMRLLREAAANAPAPVPKRTTAELIAEIDALQKYVIEVDDRVKRLESLLADRSLGQTLASVFPSVDVVKARANGTPLVKEVGGH